MEADSRLGLLGLYQKRVADQNPGAGHLLWRLVPQLSKDCRQQVSKVLLGGVLLGQYLKEEGERSYQETSLRRILLFYFYDNDDDSSLHEIMGLIVGIFKHLYNVL